MAELSQLEVVTIQMGHPVDASVQVAAAWLTTRTTETEEPLDAEEQRERPSPSSAHPLFSAHNNSSISLVHRKRVHAEIKRGDTALSNLKGPEAVDDARLW